MMKAKNWRWVLGLVTVGLAMAGVPAFAQVETSTGVGRISLIRGDVSTRRGDTGSWVAATTNTPLVPGDTIATGAGSRAEVQLDYADVVRLDQNAEVKVADLTRSRIQLQVARGTVDYVVLGGGEANSEVDTPNVAVEPSGAGVYRLDVNSQDLSQVTVREGRAQISTPQGSTTIDNGQEITVQGGENPEYQTASAQPRDDWDNWNQERDRVIERAANYDHVNRHYTGAQDLDSYGHWVYVPNYDWCWTPYVNAGWVPYSTGQWVWEPYWGWTWVSYEPWGWAPYHYGRWFFWGGNWCWWPGYVTAGFYPVWAPAYVSFIGFGYGRFRFGFGFGYGFNSIGWCPLGPRDEFRPWWGRGHSFNVVNITNITNINNINNVNNINNINNGGRGFRTGREIRPEGRTFTGSNLQMAMTDPQVRRGITTVPANDFGRGRVERNRTVVSAASLREASLVQGTLPVVPTRASLSATNRAAVVPAVARSTGDNVRFFSRNGSPAPARTMPFTSQAASIRQMMVDHRPQSTAGLSASERTTAAEGARGEMPAPARFGEANHGGSSFRAGSMANAQGRAEAAPAAPGFEAQRQGWHRFGEPARQAPAAGREQKSWPAAVNFGVGGQTNEARQNSAARQSSGDRAAPNQGWHRFSDRAPGAARTAPNQTAPGNRGSERVSSPREAPAATNRQADRPGWNQFTSRPRPENVSPDQGRGREFSRPRPDQGNGGRPGWGRFSEPPPPSYNSGRAQRPPLELNKPIVTERRPQYNQSPGYSPRTEQAPRYQQESPRYSSPRTEQAPRYQQESPRYSSPRYEQAPRYSAPSREAPRSSSPPSRGRDNGHGRD